MGFDVSQIPSTATVTNNTPDPVVLAGLYTIAASAVGTVIDLTKFTGSTVMGGKTLRQAVWQALVEAHETSTARPVSPVTITATNPNVLPLTAGAYDNRSKAVDAILAPRPGMPGNNGGMIVANSRNANSYVLLTLNKGAYRAHAAPALTAADLLCTFAQNGGVATNTVIASVQTAAGGALAGGESVIRVNLTVTGVPSGVEGITLTPKATMVDVEGKPFDPSTAVALLLV
jgi:hypothetical protein